MTTSEIISNLLVLADKYSDAGQVKTAMTLYEASALLTELVEGSQHRHPASQTSNGDPVATFFNNVVSIKKAGL